MSVYKLFKQLSYVPYYFYQKVNKVVQLPKTKCNHIN